MEKAKPPCCVDPFLFFCGVTVYQEDSPGLQRREAGYFCSQRSMKSPRKRMRGWRGDGSGRGEQGANVATLFSGKHFFLFLGKTDDVWGWVCGSWDLAFAAQAFASCVCTHCCVFSFPLCRFFWILLTNLLQRTEKGEDFHPLWASTKTRLTFMTWYNRNRHIWFLLCVI